jgi:hypothetical protein
MAFDRMTFDRMAFDRIPASVFVTDNRKDTMSPI